MMRILLSNLQQHKREKERVKKKTAAKARRNDEKKNKQQGKKEKEKERNKARGISLRRSKEVLCREIDVFHHTHTVYVYIL